MSALEAIRVSDTALPVVDVGGLSSSRLADRRAVAAEIGAACRDKGFLYITGHGVPEGLIGAVLAETKALFDLPTEAKLAVDQKRSFCNRGYEPVGAQALEVGAAPDVKEGFYLGPELALDHPLVVARRFNQGPNQWPADLPGFAPTMKAYFAAMLDLGERMMRGIALSLDLDEDHFADFGKGAYAILRLLHYPPRPGEKGAGEHTDFGGVTLLLQDDVGGLQVKGADGWIHAAPIPGAFVVNLGDMMARWTNGRYRSTLHRVVNASGRERYSVPFFYDGSIDYKVECLPTCLAPGETPKYPPTTVEGHMREMYERIYAGL